VGSPPSLGSAQVMFAAEGFAGISRLRADLFTVAITKRTARAWGRQ